MHWEGRRCGRSAASFLSHGADWVSRNSLVCQVCNRTADGCRRGCGCDYCLFCCMYGLGFHVVVLLLVVVAVMVMLILLQVSALEVLAALVATVADATAAATAAC